jgi:cystathionine beta-lyase/cystathionine gamma-synthase
MKTETLLIHGGGDNPLGAVSPPIFLTSTFKNAAIHGYSYSRCANPTREALEKTVALAEGGKYGFAFSSGLAAEDAVFSLADRVIVGKNVYGGTRRLLKNFVSKFAEVVYVDTSKPEEVEKEAAIKSALIFAETPANPLMNITDIRKMAEISKKYGCTLVIDNTFLTPVLQRPLLLGADIALHSATKYLCGHHDSTAGCVVTNDGKIAEKLYLALSTKGNGLSPFDSFLVKRGLETLALRMRAHCENAARIFDFLKTRREIDKIYYAGDPESEGFEVMKGQTDGFGGMISFEISEMSDYREFLSGLKLIAFAESLGGNATLITHPYTQTHASLTAKEKEEAGIKKNLFRLSVGTEDAGDIINDLENAFDEM